jgi:hypothetical protein
MRVVAEPDAQAARKITVSPGWAPCALPATEGSIEGPGASPFQLQLI